MSRNCFYFCLLRRIKKTSIDYTNFLIKLLFILLVAGCCFEYYISEIDAHWLIRTSCDIRWDSKLKDFNYSRPIILQQFANLHSNDFGEAPLTFSDLCVNQFESFFVFFFFYEKNAGKKNVLFELIWNVISMSRDTFSALWYMDYIVWQHHLGRPFWKIHAM